MGKITYKMSKEIEMISDNILVGYLYSILDTISTSETPSLVLTKISTIREELLVLDSTSSITVFINVISEITEILDTLLHGINKNVAEIVSMSETIADLSSFINTILSEILVSESNDDTSSIVLLLSESFTSSETISSTSIFNNILDEDIVIIIGDLDGGEEYVSYLLSPETFSVSTYSNYNFNHATKYLDNYLFINNSGLYKYGGTLDVSSYINAKIKTAALSFGTSNLKQLPNFYMGLSNSNEMVLKVSVDGSSTSYYKLTKQSENLQTQKIAIGKGLIGRYFQFEIITQENTEFELDNLEFYPLTLKRKI